MQIDLARLRHIVAVDRLRSFSRAAEELHITQPALSRSVASFEQGFGVRLFDRGRGGVVTTEVGELVSREAAAILRSVGDLEHNIRQVGAGKAGKIAIGLGPLAASLVLPALSRTLIREIPALQLKAAINHGEELLQDLLADEIEVIFANSWSLGTTKDIIEEPVGSVRLELIVRGGHPLVSRQALEMSDLHAFPVANAVELPSAFLTGEAGAFVCDNYHILRETVLGTDCVCLASPELLEDDIAAGRLAVLDVAGAGPIENVVSMIRRRGRTMSPAAEAIAALVEDISARNFRG